MVAGFGLHDSLVDISGTQFDTIYKYDLAITLHPDTSPQDIINVLEESGIAREDITLSRSESAAIISAGGAANSGAGTASGGRKLDRTNITLITSNAPKAFSQFVNLINTSNNRQFNLDEDSVVITQGISQSLKIKEGDTLQFEDSDGRRGSAKISEVTKNYVGAACYIGEAEYENIFKRQSDCNTLYIKTNLTSNEEREKFITNLLSQEALRTGSIMNIAWTAQIREAFTKLMNGINMVVVLLIAAAGMLAMIVLYNLININIAEREREISTLRVLGFRHNETAFYIFREITVLCVLGSLCGLPLGAALHYFLIHVASTADTFFSARIAPASFIFSFLFSMIFSAAAAVLQIQKIRGISMTASMKSID
jgi:putative ABC transport system permease protein